MSFLRLYRDAYSGLPRPVWFLSVVMLLNRAGTMVMPFMALYLKSDHGFTTVEVGRYIMLFGSGAIAGSWVSGQLTDRFSPLLVQVAAMTGQGVGLLVFATLEARASMAVCLFLTGFSAEAYRPAGMTLFSSVCPAKLRTKGFGLLRLAVNAGMTIGPAVGGYLALRDYALLFWIDGVTCIAAAGVLWAFFPRGETAGPRVRAGEDAGDGAAGDGDVSPWRDRGFLLMCGFNLLLAFVFFQLESTIPLFLEEGPYGLREDDIGLLFATNTVLIVALEMVLVHWLRDRDTIRVVAIGAALVGVGFGMLGFGSALWWAVLSIAVFTFGEMTTAPFFSAYVANRAGDGNRGRYMAMSGMAFTVGMLLAPVCGTWIYSRLGPDVLWTTFIVIGIVTGVGYELVGRRSRRDGEPALDPHSTEETPA